MPDIDTLFKGMRDARMSRPKTYMAYGRYLVELKEIKSKRSEKDGSDLFIAGFTVVESDNDQHKPGSEGSWTLSGQRLQYGLGEIKQLILSVMGVDWHNIVEGGQEHSAASLLLRYVLGSPSAAAEIAALPEHERPTPDFYKGTKVRLETKPKSETKPFTRHFWTPA